MRPPVYEWQRRQYKTRIKNLKQLVLINLLGKLTFFGGEYSASMQLEQSGVQPIESQKTYR